MSWLILSILLYLLIGAILVERSMRGAEIRASFLEWMGLFILWPLCLKLFLHMMFLQSQMKAIKILAEKELPRKRE